jgi:hypothetical protein
MPTILASPPPIVIPAKAGIHGRTYELGLRAQFKLYAQVMDSRLRGNDKG